MNSEPQNLNDSSSEEKSFSTVDKEFDRMYLR